MENKQKKKEKEMIRMVEAAAKESNRAQKELVERAPLETFLREKLYIFDKNIYGWDIADNERFIKKVIREAWEKGVVEGLYMFNDLEKKRKQK